jgi:hypothetical protein
MIVQISYTALAHGSYTIEERLARFLLMSFDRNSGEELPLMHEFISRMLAVRRSGVTTALHVLEGHGATKALRGHVHLRDRQVLEDLAQGSYGGGKRVRAADGNQIPRLGARSYAPINLNRCFHLPL